MLVVIGKKIDQSQRFLEDGTRIPVTRIDVQPLPVVDVKTMEKNKYTAVSLGYGTNPKKPRKSLLGILKKAKIQEHPRTIREVRLTDDETLPEIGSYIKVEEVLEPGDMIQVTGTSKGKGFAGGVKRHNFAGGPKTHGQSDRHRAPGSIGQGTTPGRVYKGKRMAGRMGGGEITVKNLKVISIEGQMLLVEGLVPGPANNMITIKKIGKMKKFVPLYRSPEEIEKEQQALQEEQQAATPVESEVKEPEAQVEQAEAKAEESAGVEKTSDTDAPKEEQVAEEKEQEKEEKDA